MIEHDYTYVEHRFRFAAWAATRAIQAGSAIKGFKVKDAQDILEEIGLDKIAGKDYWLLEIDDFDAQHTAWRKSISDSAKKKGFDRMTHGRAAKLINVFIKVLMPSDMYSISPELRERWGKVHPPIDRNMLKKMDEKGFGGKKDWGKVGWQKLNCCEYQCLIDNIRKHEPCFWKIERFWKL